MALGSISSQDFSNGASNADVNRLSGLYAQHRYPMHVLLSLCVRQRGGSLDSGTLTIHWLPEGRIQYAEERLKQSEPGVPASYLLHSWGLTLATSQLIVARYRGYPLKQPG